MSDIEKMLNDVLSNPEEMKKIMDVANSLMSGGETSPSEHTPSSHGTGEQGQRPEMSDLLKGISSMPPEASAAAMKIINNMQEEGHNEKYAALSAMKPYLSHERRVKLDRAMQMARVLKTGLILFGENGGLI